MRHTPAALIAGVHIGPDPEAGLRELDPLRHLGEPLLDLSAIEHFTDLQQGFDPFFPKGKLYYWKSTYLDTLSDEAIDVLVARGDESYGRSRDHRPSRLPWCQRGGRPPWTRWREPLDASERAARIERYGAGPDVLMQAWSEVPPACRQWKPARGDWSAHEIIVHCADSEAFAAMRIRLLAAEPLPLIVGYDQDAWVTTFDYHRQPVELAFDTIRAVRRLTHALLLHLDDAIWGRSGSHTESGAYSAADWLATYAAHLHDHADQIASNVERWHASR